MRVKKALFIRELLLNWRDYMLRLERLDERNITDCLRLKVDDEKHTHASLITESLAKAFVNYNQVSPFAIYNGRELVGFIMIRFIPEDNNYLIPLLVIKDKCHEMDFKKQALRLLIDWIKMDPRCNEIVTTYKTGNDKHEKLYRELGFQQSLEKNDHFFIKLGL